MGCRFSSPEMQKEIKPFPYDVKSGTNDIFRDSSIPIKIPKKHLVLKKSVPLSWKK